MWGKKRRKYQDFGISKSEFSLFSSIWEGRVLAHFFIFKFHPSLLMIFDNLLQRCQLDENWPGARRLASYQSIHKFLAQDNLYIFFSLDFYSLNWDLFTLDPAPLQSLCFHIQLVGRVFIEFDYWIRLTQGRSGGRRREEKKYHIIDGKMNVQKETMRDFYAYIQYIRLYASMRLWQIKKRERVISVTIEAPADVGEISLFVVGNFHIIWNLLCNPQSPTSYGFVISDQRIPR